ncbi:hypothetical protein [Phaeovulum sp.]|uniref:hypothetical protein n=1 Tax=Phaeovulum sp. TaxID=2934796 RepID=UPI00356854C2
MADVKQTDEMLEALFDEARFEAFELPPGLLARVLADADAELAARTAPPPRATAARGISGFGAVLKELFGAIGGWPAVSGLASATVAGVWIGFAGVGGLALTTADLLGGDETLAVMNLLPGDDVFALATDLGDFE